MCGVSITTYHQIEINVFGKKQTNKRLSKKKIQPLVCSLSVQVSCSKHTCLISCTWLSLPHVNTVQSPKQTHGQHQSDTWQPNDNICTTQSLVTQTRGLFAVPTLVYVASLIFAKKTRKNYLARLVLDK